MTHVDLGLYVLGHALGEWSVISPTEEDITDGLKIVVDNMLRIAREDYPGGTAGDVSGAMEAGRLARDFGGAVAFEEADDVESVEGRIY